MGLRFFSLLPAFLVCACCASAPPQSHIFNAKPLAPEGWYAAIYTEVRRCAVQLGKATNVAYDDIEWYQVEAGRMGAVGYVPAGDSQIIGTASFPNRIYLDERFTLSGPVIRHELSHVLLKIGSNGHEDPEFLLCSGTV